MFTLKINSEKDTHSKSILTLKTQTPLPVTFFLSSLFSHFKAGIKQVLPSAELEDSMPGNYTYRIPIQGFKMSSMLSALIDNKESMGIKDWGISQTSLEDVFLNIVKNDETK